MTTDPFRLDGKSVLITGAGGGIGRALVATFTRAGAKIIGVDRDLNAMGGLPLADRFAVELGDTRATSESVRSYLEQKGVPDVVVSNAGFTRAETFADLDLAAWESEVAINLNGAYALCGPIVDAMADRGSGSLVFVSSVNGLAHFGNPAYSAAKAGLIAYAKAIAVECGARGIRANIVAPGSVRTPAWDHRLAEDPGLLAKVLPHYPLGHLVSPDDVANAVLFLATSAAAGITGAVIPVDAGLMAGNLRFVDDILRKGE